MPSQLGLPLSIRNDERFDNFLAVPGSARAQAAVCLRDHTNPDNRFVYLWGSRGAGKNHLLLASCHEYQSRGLSVQYLPLTDVVAFDPSEVLNGLEEVDLICLHGLDGITDHAGWQEAIFHLYNRLLDTRRRLIVSAEGPPPRIGMTLADLTSRLSQGVVFHLPPYSDQEKMDIVRFRGKCLGLEISDECANFIVNRDSRELSDLMARLRELDKASLQAQRKVTIPFVKTLFSW